MKARVAIQIGVTPKQWKVLKAAADARSLPLAVFVREAALLCVEDNPELQRVRDVEPAR